MFDNMVVLEKHVTGRKWSCQQFTSLPFFLTLWDLPLFLGLTLSTTKKDLLHFSFSSVSMKIQKNRISLIFFQISKPVKLLIKSKNKTLRRHITHIGLIIFSNFPNSEMVWKWHTSVETVLKFGILIFSWASNIWQICCFP